MGTFWCYTLDMVNLLEELGRCLLFMLLLICCKQLAGSHGGV